MTLASASLQVGCRRKPISAGDTAAGRGAESGKTDAPEAVFAVNQGAQAVLNAMRRPGNGILNAIKRHPKRGVDYAFNTPGAAPSGGCAARRSGCPTLLNEQDLRTVPTRSPTSFPTACAIFELPNDTLDIAYNTLTSKNRLLCLPVRLVPTDARIVAYSPVRFITSHADF